MSDKLEPGEKSIDWAKAQVDLGNALRTLGERESETARLQEALDIYRAAMEVFERENLPMERARTQYNLGLTLKALGE